MWADLTDQVALITGGTRGIGLAIGKALASRGAKVIATYRWDQAAAEEARLALADSGPAQPVVIESDASNLEDTRALIGSIAESDGRLDILISNVAVSARGGDLSTLNRRDFARSLGYSTWPLLTHIDAIEQRLGRLPRYVIATSSDGPDHYYPGYDYVACSKAALEGLVLELAARTAGGEVRVNILRARQTWTESLTTMFSGESLALLQDHFDAYSILPEEVGAMVVAMTSGLLDGLHGQVLNLDRGSAFLDNFMSIAPMLARGAR